MMPIHRVLITFLLMVFVTACSFNGMGVVKFEICATERAQIISTTAKGLHMYTKPAFGIQIGKISMQSIYPVINENSASCAEYIHLPPAPCLIPTDLEYASTNYAAKPIKTVSQRAGLGIEISPYALNISLGANHKQVMRAASDATFSMYYNNLNQPSHPDVCALITRER